jgi:hypothetical protein
MGTSDRFDSRSAVVRPSAERRSRAQFAGNEADPAQLRAITGQPEAVQVGLRQAQTQQNRGLVCRGAKECAVLLKCAFLPKKIRLDHFANQVAFELAGGPSGHRRL